MTLNYPKYSIFTGTHIIKINTYMYIDTKLTKIKKYGLRDADICFSDGLHHDSLI